MGQLRLPLFVILSALRHPTIVCVKNRVQAHVLLHFYIFHL